MILIIPFHLGFLCIHTANISYYALYGAGVGTDYRCTEGRDQTLSDCSTDSGVNEVTCRRFAGVICCKLP